MLAVKLNRNGIVCHFIVNDMALIHEDDLNGFIENWISRKLIETYWATEHIEISHCPLTILFLFVIYCWLTLLRHILTESDYYYY